jgi:hypothetical protein
METSKTKERLRKKLQKKSKKVNNDVNDESETDLFKMLNDVNKMLKENPNMVKKVSKCVNSIFENKDLMNTLASEIGSKINLTETEKVSESLNNEKNTHEDHTLVNNSEDVELDASLKEDKQ